MSTLIEFKYIGPTYTNCDPSKAQKDALSSDQSWQSTLTNSYKTVFGLGTSMYQKLSGGLDSIISKGREAMGYSPQELALKNSEAINSAAASAKSVNRAIGAKASMSSATPGVESGVVQAERAGADTSIMNNLSNKEADITEQGFQVQREGFDKAVAEKEGSLSASFSPSTSMDSGVTSANAAVSEQANANQSTSSSWMGMVGGLADAAVGAVGTAYACVALDTLIRLAFGSDVPANELEVGDLLFGYEGADPITKIERSVQPCVEVTLEYGNPIVVSESHTFAHAAGGYVFAKDAAGEKLVSEDGYVQVKSVESVGDRTVLRIYLSKNHGYVSNSIWSLE